MNNSWLTITPEQEARYLKAANDECRACMESCSRLLAHKDPISLANHSPWPPDQRWQHKPYPHERKET